MLKLQMADESFASVSGGNYWAERGEAGLKLPTMEGARRARLQDTIDPQAIDQRGQLARSTIQSRRLMG